MVKESAFNAGDPGSIPGSGRSPGEGNGNPLQDSCLENPMDGGAWWAAVHGVTKSRTRPSDFTFTFFLAPSWYSVSAEMSSPQRNDHPFYQNCSPSTQICMSLLSNILPLSIFSMAPPTPQTCIIHVSVHFCIPRFPPVENLKPCPPVSHIFFSSWNNAGYIGGVWQPGKLSTGFYISFRSFDKYDS